MNWRDVAEGAYQEMVGAFGESFVITSGDDLESAALTGVYDRRLLIGGEAGSEIHVLDYQIGFPESALPSWVEDKVATDSVLADIREDRLRVTAVRPDGQGWVYLACRHT